MQVLELKLLAESADCFQKIEEIMKTISTVQENLAKLTEDQNNNREIFKSVFKIIFKLLTMVNSK